MERLSPGHCRPSGAEVRRSGPGPADGGECLGHHVAGADHPRSHPVAVQVGTGQRCALRARTAGPIGRTAVVNWSWGGGGAGRWWRAGGCGVSLGWAGPGRSRRDQAVGVGPDRPGCGFGGGSVGCLRWPRRLLYRGEVVVAGLAAGAAGGWLAHAPASAATTRTPSMTCQAWRLTAIGEGLTRADRQCQAWRSMKHLAKLARRWRPGAATLCTTTPGDSLARTFGRKLRFASRAELTQERRRRARPRDAPGRLDSPGASASVGDPRPAIGIRDGP
jgi:hypothetical protein